MTMVVFFRDPTDEPYGCLHPSVKYRGAFRHEGTYWSTVTQYCLAQQLVLANDREFVRYRVRDVAEAEAAAVAMARRPDADERAYDVLLFALQRSFETNLGLRAVLVGTGDEAIEARLDDPKWGTGSDGHGENLLGRALMEVRAIVAARANDATAIQCRHQEGERISEICLHRLDGVANMPPVRRRFTGIGREYQLLCAACVDALPTAPVLRRICGECLDEYAAGARGDDVGSPAFLERSSSLTFAHRPARLVGEPAMLLALTPISRRAHAWWALDRSGRLLAVDTEHDLAVPHALVDTAELDFTGPLNLHVAPQGELVAIAEAKGRRAIVLDPRSGEITHRIVRDDYHEEHCRFPLGFFEQASRLLLVHATAWNRLDVSDPRTGELLTARTSPRYESSETKPPHYLDYFHAGLVVSPGGTRVLDNGWIWSPYGEVRVFSLTRWITENPWESEDGPSLHQLNGRGYYWDGPVAWLDDKTVAVWGEGDDDELLTPAVTIWDAETGGLLRRFDGPAQGLATVGLHLLSFDAHGTSVWDVTTGERLLHDPSFEPFAVHPTSGEMISRVRGPNEDGFRIGALVGRADESTKSETPRCAGTSAFRGVSRP